MAADIIDTLHPQNDLETSLYPNIVAQNIPTGAVSKDKLAQIVQNQIDNPVPQDGTITIAKFASDVMNRLNNPTIPLNYVSEAQLTTAVQSKLNNPPIPDNYVGLTKLTSEVRSLLSADWTEVTTWPNLSSIGTGIYKIDGCLKLMVSLQGATTKYYTFKNAIVYITNYHTAAGGQNPENKYASIDFKYMVSGASSGDGNEWSSSITISTDTVSTRAASYACYNYKGSLVKLA